MNSAKREILGLMNNLLAKIHDCTICASHLPHGVRPILQADPRARILIVGQAPGRLANLSGSPFDDPSGDRLRRWMGVDRKIFYDATRIAILPMGFCYPGRGKSGDLPPRAECAPAWRNKILNKLCNIELTLIVGRYGLSYHLPEGKGTLTNIVREWKKYLPEKIPLVHPSPRNNHWLKKNPWFEEELIPELQLRVAEVLSKE